MSTVDPICLKALSEEESWSLFVSRAFFRDGNERMPPNLVGIGKEMVKKCRGLPLAVKTLGSLMRYKREESEWLSILESKIMGISEDENIILNSLRLSYNDLPSYLKSCFMFCSIFPKGYKFEKDTLIKIWMVEGFIQPSRSQVRMEDVVCEFFNKLLSRSFIHDVEKDIDGNIISCKMHDLLHDLAQSIAGDKYQMIDFSTSRSISNRVRHSSLVYDHTVHPTNLQRLYECKKLRTILNFGEGAMIKESLNSLFSNFRRLRVLDLGSRDITELPNTIGNLKYLRYLNISGNRFRTLPESICSLWNLKTLKIRHCINFCELPKGMKNLINLRYLEIDSDNQLNCMPIGIGKLTGLDTLSIFFVGKESGALIGELQGLNFLQGNLEIRNVENIKNIEDANEARLKNKEWLHCLIFHWSDCNEVGSEEEQAVVEGVFEALQPHTNLNRLCIEDYIGDKFPSWMGDSSFTNLARVDLNNCKRSEHLPPLGKLELLKHLTISGADGVKYLPPLPLLEFLEIRDIPHLEELVRNHEEEMTRLCSLKIESCPKLRLLQHLPCLLHLQILNHCKLMSSSEGLLHLTSLRTLELSDCDEIAVTFKHHPSLETLLISNCPHLTSLPDGLLQNLDVFQNLEIRHCPKLTSLPERLENLIALRSLSFIGCDELVSLPQIMQHLSSVQGLRFDGSTNLPSSSSSSDGAWTRLTDLKTLFITYKLGSLQYLIPYSTTFESLCIYNCPKVESLPDALENCTTLRNIDISGCPLLESRCRGGKDWHKIAHVPNISIQNLPMTSAASVTDELG